MFQSQKFHNKNLVNPREFESLFQPWKGCVLTVRRWVQKNKFTRRIVAGNVNRLPTVRLIQVVLVHTGRFLLMSPSRLINMVPTERFELPTYWLQISCTTAVLYGRNLWQLPQLPQMSVASHARICASKPYPENIIFKQQEQSRRTLYQPCTYILTHKSAKHNSRKPTLINTLEKIAVFGAGGKIHRHLGTQVLPQEDEGVAKHAGKSYNHYIVQSLKNQSLIALTTV